VTGPWNLNGALLRASPTALAWFDESIEATTSAPIAPSAPTAASAPGALRPPIDTWATAGCADPGGARRRDPSGALAGKLVGWQYGLMKTTLDLPDDLVRRIKIEAAKSDRKLKDLVAQLLEAGLRASRDGGPTPALPKPVKRRRGGPLTADAIEAAIAAGRE
jgi:hypothetical protein